MNSSEVRRAAGQVEQIGQDVHQLANRLLGVCAVEWRSAAADEFRRRAGTGATEVHRAAIRCELAAQALHRLAVNPPPGFRP
jgi:hypothetical protein